MDGVVLGVALTAAVDHISRGHSRTARASTARAEPRALPSQVGDALGIGVLLSLAVGSRREA
jgi:hypothetical protein